MKSTTNVILNMQLPNYSTVVYAVQGDVMSREIKASLQDGSSPFEPPYGVLGSIRYMKPDGTVGLYDTMEDNTTPAVVISGNVATILLAEQMLTVVGEVVAQLSLYSQNAERLSSFTFKVIVEENPYTDEAFESTDYFSVLTESIASVLAVVDNMPAPSTINPLMDGTASQGVRGEFARSDHVHPSDTSRVKKEGDTVTGNLLVKSSNIESGTVVSTDNTLGNTFGFTDNSSPTSSVIGTLRPIFRTDGRQGIRLQSSRTISGSPKQNYLALYIDGSNNHTVDLSDPSAWLAALGLTTTTITGDTAKALLSVGTGVTISDANFAIWGKTVMLYFVFTRSTAVTGADTATSIATVASDYRPAYRSAAFVTASSSPRSYPTKCYINSNGAVYVVGQIDTTQTLQVSATYILS